MAGRKRGNPGQSARVVIDLGRPNSEPQRKFFSSRAKYTCYGGARGGGKTWAVRTKALGGALEYAGIKILIIRKTYRDMEASLILPLVKMIPPGAGNYNDTKKVISFINGSSIRFGHLPSYGATVEGEYQGQEYDWIFIDEATQFTEPMFRALGACLRGVNKIPKRMYLTCNPGGVGHQWVKRLFVDRRFKDAEKPGDYVFIPAKFSDNLDLVAANPEYEAMLDNLPENIRRAHRDGDWNALAGQFFGEFDLSVHTVEPFEIPPDWKRFRAFDYGLDCFACIWVATDYSGRCWVYREYAQSDMIVSRAAQAAQENTGQGERIEYTIAPPDMWSREKLSGKTMAHTFVENGLPLVRGNNSRVQGWMAVKEMLRIQPDGKPKLLIFSSCRGLIQDIQAIQHDDKNPNDVATQPHDITHRPDALRYFCQSLVIPPEKDTPDDDEDDETLGISYQEAMCGGRASPRYLAF